MQPLEELALLQSQMDELKAAHSRALKALSKRDTDRAELVEAVYRAAKDASLGLAIKPVAAPAKQPKSRRNAEEVAVPLLSDLQLAKVTPTYNSDICEERVEKYADKIIALTNIQRSDHPVRKAHVTVLGDVVEGTMIFPGQSFLVDGGLYEQVTVNGPRILVNFFRRLLSEFDEVEATMVIGNHGRIGGRASKDGDPQDNADRMLYRIVQQIFESMGEKRIKFNIPDAKGDRAWYAVANVGKWRALCMHGDQFRGGGTIGTLPFYSVFKKTSGWASGGLDENFDAVLAGHWHQGALLPINKRNVYINGSTESTNPYATEMLSAQQSPSQWLLFVHPEDGIVTAQYQVWLDNRGGRP
jgi:hypothetical protein